MNILERIANLFKGENSPQDYQEILNKKFDLKKGKREINSAITQLNELGKLYEERKVFLEKLINEAKDEKTRKLATSLLNSKPYNQELLTKSIDRRIRVVERELLTSLHKIFNSSAPLDLSTKEGRHAVWTMLDSLKNAN